MRLRTTFALFLFLLTLALPLTPAQQIVRITEPTAINPAEVSIAINKR